jgi:hypothetical protein
LGGCWCSWTPQAGHGRGTAPAGRLSIAVKVITGDHPAAAVKACRDLELGQGDALTGADLDTLDDPPLAVAIARTTVFARISPEHKARIARTHRHGGGGVAFLDDGATTRSPRTRPMWASRSTRSPTPTSLRAPPSDPLATVATRSPRDQRILASNRRRQPRISEYRGDIAPDFGDTE